MTIFNTYRQYILIFSLSLLLGLIRWSILDRNFPLISKPNIIVDEFINFNDFKDVVDNNSYPIVDARDFYSYEEGFIGNAYNLDIDLIYESDEESIININNIIDNHGYRDNLINIVDSKFSIVDVNNDNQKIIVYCWSPTCDRAEELISILIDTSEYFGSFGKYFKKSDFSIYKGGWEEWDSILKQK